MSATNDKIKIANYKCFGPEPQGFDRIMPMNLIVGRNSSGKSSLIDLIEYSISGIASISDAQRRPKAAEAIHIETSISEAALRRAFPATTSGGGIPASNWWEYGKAWIGRPIHLCLTTIDGQTKRTVVSIDPPFDQLTSNRALVESTIVNDLPMPFDGKVLKRLYAERNIVPEADTDQLNLTGHGVGATNLIQQILNNAKYPRDLVSKKLLAELNSIFHPDALFTNILARKQLSGLWEIFLETKNDTAIALSQSGSGLKTILLVVVFFLLFPYIESKPQSSYVYAFEELENNLHPAALRRLLNYIREYAISSGCKVFLTTHSSAAIDLFSRDSSAQILHVTHNGDYAQVRTTTTYVEHRGILDDLDIRASDLLQSNGVIWVEGPSDRIYLNQWINLWSGAKLKEGLHYQIVFYGGRLLSHLTANDPDFESEWINILRINRNAVMVIDSDKESPEGKINETKTRLVSEVTEMGGLAWVTAGKEIENYVPFSLMRTALGCPGTGTLDQYKKITDALDAISDGLGDKFHQKKTLIAEKVASQLTKENPLLDLGTNMEKVCEAIRRWNSISENA